MRSDLKKLRAMFVRMKADGELDPTKPLTWGFFFMDPTRKNLSKVAKELDGQDYVTASLHQTDEGTWVLQLSRVERLTAEGLHERNVAFNELAERCGVALYDGWDVGTANPTLR
jgi:hypothetical protein